MAITTHDLNQLIREPSPRVRSHIAAKVSQGFNCAQFTSNETKLAIDIFRLLMRDTSASVRRAIAENLKYSTHVPRDVILSLAKDEADIAVPVIECSELLSDDDLIELIESSREVRKWLAISRRARLSKRVSRQLVATRNDDVVISLIGNDGAELDDSGLESVLREFSGHQNVLEALVCRGGLSAAFAEKLHSHASAQVKKQLTRRFRLPWGLVSPQIDAIRETAMLRFFSERISDADLSALVAQMLKNRRLSDSIIIRAMLCGEVRFVEAALSARAGIPRGNVHALLSDRGVLGFRTLYLAASMPPDYLEPLDLVLRFMQQDGCLQSRRAGIEGRLLNHLLAHGYDKSVPGMPALIELLHVSHEPRTLH